MKKLILLCSALLFIACQRSENEDITPSLACNRVYNSNSAVNYWGVLSRTTCKAGDGAETEIVSNPSGNRLLMAKSSATVAVKTKANHFWFYDTNGLKLFKPVTYARVFVFDDNATTTTLLNSAKTQITGGNHYLGFDTGVFKDVYPLYVLNINHKLNSTGTTTTSYNLESEIKKSIPVGKRVFIQFIVQSSPTSPIPTTFATARYAYADYLNPDDGLFPHYKIDLSATNLGYTGKPFYYN